MTPEKKNTGKNNKIPVKKFKKSPKIPPKGFETSNDFFNYVFENKELIWMGQNTNHLHDNDAVVNAMIDCVKSGYYCKYPAPEGFPELKKLILEELGLENMDTLLTAGATESLYLCMHDIIDSTDNVILSDPGYLIIGAFAERFTDDVRYIPIYNDECGYILTPELVKENMDENTKIIVLIDPLNPLGSSYSEEQIKEFAKIAIENDCYLIHDVTYMDFAREHFLASKYAPENTITIYSFSKIFGLAGLRVGAVVAPKVIIDSIKNVVINDLGVNIIAQTAALAGLKSKDSWINDIKNITRKNQDLIKETVDEIDGVFLPVYPADGNMMVIDLTGVGINPKDMANYLLDKNIFAREGTYTSKLFGDRYLRVSFSIPEDEIKIFCKEFKSAVETLRKK